MELSFAGVHSGRETLGHRFLGSRVELTSPSEYTAQLKAQHVLVDSAEREARMVEALHAAAAELGGQLILDDFLVKENLSLVEEPHVVAGHFDEAFLALPERVILDVAKDHQRYFGVRAASGALMPRYLAVVNTAEQPNNILRGNDRVMRARLSDAKFFYDEDLKQPLGERRQRLDAIVFHKRLGSVGDKVRRIERLVPLLGSALGISDVEISVAVEGAGLAKCDLVSLMVQEFPELQGEMGAAYAEQQGTSKAVARVIVEHYLPRGAEDAIAPSPAGALVALADRLDTLVGCFGVGLVPTGTADPLALRRASIGFLRTLLVHQRRAELGALVSAAYAGFNQGQLDHSQEETREKLLEFFKDRLRGLLADRFSTDVVDAALAVSPLDPFDGELRCQALSALEPELRGKVGEVFKRASNIAKQAKEVALKPPSEFQAEVQPEEQALYAGFKQLEQELKAAEANYPQAIAAIGRFAPLLAAFFEAVFVMVDDLPLRENRLRLMKEIELVCSRIANFNLLAR